MAVLFYFYFFFVMHLDPDLHQIFEFDNMDQNMIGEYFI